MVTASHNPPSDNAVKAYWSTGGQVLPPHDKGVIDRVMSVGAIERVPFDTAVADGRIEICQDEVDPAYVAAVLTQALPGPRDLKIIYSPLHGVGASAVLPVLAAMASRMSSSSACTPKPDGDFPNVPGHVSNPENPHVFDTMIAHGSQTGADLVVATDPDCDRIGCAAPLTPAAGAQWLTLTGNQIGALLADYVLESRKAAGTLSPEHFIVEDARHHGDDPPHRRQLRREDVRRQPRRLQVDRRRHRREGPDKFRLRHRGIARLPGRQLRPRQGRRPRLDAAVRAGRQAQSRRRRRCTRSSTPSSGSMAFTWSGLSRCKCPAAKGCCG